MATFDERARDWDTPDRIARAGEVARAIKQAVPLRPTDRLIDIGAGTGLLGLALVDDVGEIVLSDPSAGMIEVATEKLAAAGLLSARAVRHDPLADAPLDDRFDVAVSLLVLHHIADTEEPRHVHSADHVREARIAAVQMGRIREHDKELAALRVFAS